MEFLMTYGWAILVVLVVIGALAYFGVLSPSSLLPEKCTLPLQLSCKDHRVIENEVRFNIQNGAGRDMRVTRVALQSDALLDGACSKTFANDVPNGQSVEFVLDNAADRCDYKNTGRDKNRYTINITYNWLDSTYAHVIQGELFAKKEG